MGDDEAEAEWRVGGEVITEENTRFQVKKLDKGVHKLIILKAKLTDTGDVSCTCVGQNESKATLTVNDKGTDNFRQFWRGISRGMGFFRG